MRKLTHRLQSENESYKSHWMQFIWLIVLLIFVQQVGNGQDCDGTISATSMQVCQNDASPQVTFSFTGSGTITPYIFTYNINGASNLMVPTGANTSVSVNVPTGSSGSFEYSLVSVANDNGSGCTSAPSSSQSVIVNVTGEPTASAGIDQIICESQTTVQLDGSFGGSASSGMWSGGAGTFSDATDPDAVYTYDASEIGNIVVLYFTTNNPGAPCNYTADDDVDITINLLAGANAGTDQTICSDDVAQLNASTSGGATSGSWSGGLGSFDDDSKADAIYTPHSSEAGGTVLLTWTTDDPVGPCGPASDQVAVTVNKEALVDAGPNQTIFIDEVAQLNATVGGGTSQGMWAAYPNNGNFDDPTKPNAKFTPMATPPNSGVTFTWTSDDPSGPCPYEMDQTSVFFESREVISMNSMPDTATCSPYTSNALIVVDFEVRGGSGTYEIYDNTNAELLKTLDIGISTSESIKVLVSLSGPHLMGNINIEVRDANNTDLEDDFNLTIPLCELNDLFVSNTKPDSELIPENGPMIHDPCSCKNDQTGNGAQDGTFDETVVVKDTRPNITWTVKEFRDFDGNTNTIGGAVENVSTLEKINDSIYHINITHTDDMGYFMGVTDGDTTLVDSNRCAYPVINFSTMGDIMMTTALTLTEDSTYSGDTTFVINGPVTVDPATEIDPGVLPIGDYTVRATFTADSMSNNIDDIAPSTYANPGCLTEVTNNFSITSDSVFTDFCNCTNDPDPNAWPFADTIRITSALADSIIFDKVDFFIPNTNTIDASDFLKVNNIDTGTKWNMGDTLANIGANSFEFLAYFNGNKDAIITFVSTYNDTFLVSIPACGNPANLVIMGQDTICQGDTVMYTLNESVDSVSWTFGNKYSSMADTFKIDNVDTTGMVTVTASGSIKGNCVPFGVTKDVYVQDTSFEILGSLFACLDDTLDYTLNLKGATADYGATEGLEWNVMGGGRIIGDSINVNQVQVMWDTMIFPHMVMVSGFTTTGCPINEIIVVQVDSILGAQVSGPDTVCLGDISGYKAGIDKIDTLKWVTIPDSVGIVTEIKDDTVNIEWVEVGTFAVKVSGSADDFACEVSDTFMVTVLDTNFLLTGFNASCKGDSTGFGLRNLDGSLVQLTDINWTVTRNTNPAVILPAKDTLSLSGSSSLDSLIVKWDSIGSHTVLVTGTTVHGCEVSESIDVTVRDSIFRIFGDTIVCNEDTTQYMVYDANNMVVTNMDSITWQLFDDIGNPKGQPVTDDTINVIWSLPGEYWLRVNGMTDDGCSVFDSIRINVININNLLIIGPEKLCGVRDTLWYIETHDSLLNNIEWSINGLDAGNTFDPVGTDTDTFKMSNFNFASGVVYASMNVVITGKVGSQCTFTDTIPFIIRDTSFQIFGDEIVCNISDTARYWVDVPGIDSISWSVTGGVVTDTIGVNGDTLEIKWNSNGKITAFIRTNDGCDITDSLTVSVRESSIILGDTAVSEFDTVIYTLKGLTISDTLDFTDLDEIAWTYPVNSSGMIINNRMDSVKVVYSNQSGEPFYLDTISVAFRTDDGCMDTIVQPIQIRETTYGLMGMPEACQDGKFTWTIGSFNEILELIDLPDTVIVDIDTFTWSLPDGGMVMSSDGDSAVLTFANTGVHKIIVNGTFNDGCVFSLTDSINVRSSELELIGDVDGLFFDGQTTTFHIEEVNNGSSTKLEIGDFDGIIWAVSQFGDIPGSVPALNNFGLRNNIASTGVVPFPLSGSVASVTNYLQIEALDSFASITNGESNGMADNIDATFSNAGNNDTLFVALVTSAGCTLTEVVDIDINNNADFGSVACNNLVNVSMGPDCIFDVTPDVILEDVGDSEFDQYSIIITDSEGNFISNGRLDMGEVGKVLIVTVTHDGSGNSCWGTLFIEDKNIPELVCGQDTIECDDSILPTATHWEFNTDRYRGFPIPSSARAFPVSGQENTYVLVNFDFCGSDTLRYIDDDDPLSCADGMSRRILRSWSIISRSGFAPIGCVDTIFVKKLDIDSVDFRQFIPHQSYTCDQKATHLNPDGYPNKEITGNLDNLKDDPCYQLNAGYTDTSIGLCGNSWKFFRQWTIIDWCTQRDTTILQIIAFEDKEDPQVDRPEVFDNISDDHECTNTFSIRRPSYTDCSAIAKVRLELRRVGDADWTLWGEKLVTDEDFTNISFGSEGDLVEARYILTDECGNIGTSGTSTRIIIQDNITPVAVCDEEVVITLNDDGVAFATFWTFDDGSSDNCGIVSREIRRLDTDCTTGNPPVLDTESTQFGPLVQFCCADLGRDDVYVELKVTDAAGNTNTCMSLVTIQEIATKIKAENVPGDICISCGTDLSDLSIYGQPIFLASVCGQKLDPSLVEIQNIDVCGKGIITRTWTATNIFGVDLPIELEPGVTVLSVQQVITVGKPDEVLTESDIVFPPDIDTVGCISSLDPAVHTYLGAPIYNNAPCSDPISTYSDLIFKNVEGYCVKVVRTWSVIDWCTVEDLDRNDPNAIFFEGVQIIKLTDMVPPTIDEGFEDQSLPANTADCKGFYTFTANGSDDCEEAALKWVYELDIDSDDTIDRTGKTNAFDVSLPIGTHSIKWILSDGCDNLDTRTKQVVITDDGCTVVGNTLIIKGKIFTENNITVDNVDMRLTDLNGTTLMQQMTPENGEYAFVDITALGDYKVRPIKNDNYLNGVSTADLVLMQNHILGLKYFDSPYKVIASDVNGSGSISAIDILNIRDLILGKTDELPIKRSWSFVDATLEFDNILSPFPYTEVITMMGLDETMEAMDFVAVKMGDVNDNVVLAGSQLTGGRSVSRLTIENKIVAKNTMFSIPFEVDRDVLMAGIQMGISFDIEAAEFLGVYGNGFNVTDEYINRNYLKYGELVMSWNSAEAITIDEGDAVFELRFAARQELEVDQVIEINDTYISSEMYTNNGNGIEISALSLESRQGVNEVRELTLYQNVPNPFESTTDIHFSIPQESYIEFEIFNISGQSIYHHEARYSRGLNKIKVSEDMLSIGGVYIYQVADGQNLVQKKMIFIK